MEKHININVRAKIENKISLIYFWYSKDDRCSDTPNIYVYTHTLQLPKTLLKHYLNLIMNIFDFTFSDA